MLLQALLATVSAQTIADILSQNSTKTQTVVNALKANNLLDHFSSNTTRVFFAPSDAALEKINRTYPELYEQIAGNSSSVVDLINYHSINGTVEVKNNSRVHYQTELNQTIGISENNGTVTIHGGLARFAKVIASYNATNGVVHVVDSLIVPPQDLSLTGLVLGWTAILSVVSNATILQDVDELRNATFLVPQDSAVNNLLDQVARAGASLTPVTLATIVNTHIVPGTWYASDILDIAGQSQKVKTTLPGDHVVFKLDNSVVTIKGQSSAGVSAAKVVQTDILVSSGVAHVIDQVLLPSNGALIKSLVSKTPIKPKIKA